MDSKEDLRELATRIGLENINDLYQQRFPVKLQKLEGMLIGDKQVLNPGATFFHKIMQDTNTIVNWPSISNIRATTEDPHLTLSGRQEDVQKAKNLIENVLANKCNQVTITMDVSNTDHPYIIGKRGARTNWVMEQTGCVIYFSGLYMYDTSQKLNEVDIIGDVVGAEQARSRIRNMSPLMFRFELPNNSNTPYVHQLTNRWNVEVSLQVETEQQKMFMTVKGEEREAVRVKQATCLLRELLHGDRSDQIPIQTCMEISSHYHDDVTGKKHENLKSIMENTQTQITFPDALDILRGSKVVISGNIDNVYLARQQLMGSLPLLVVFHLPKKCQSKLTPEEFVRIQSELDVTITICPQKRQNCVIKGIERHSSNIYEARNRVLGIDEPIIVADIPPTYVIPLVGGATKVTPATSGYSPLGKSSSCMGSLKRRQEESYSSVSSTSISNSVKSPMAIASFSYESDTFAGIPEKQYKREGAYNVQTSSGTEYGVSSTSLGGVLLSDQQNILEPEENQSKREEHRQSYTPNFYQERAAEIPTVQNLQENRFQVSTSSGSGNGYNYSSFGDLQLFDQIIYESMFDSK